MNEFCYKYPRPAVTTDILLIGVKEKKAKILLIERKREPFKGYWALPGGFVDENETVEQCAERELFEETNLKINNLHLLTVKSKPDRDPRGRTITIVFWSVIKDFPQAKAKDDAKNVKWFDINNLPSLAFDHEEIINSAFDRIKSAFGNENFFNKNLKIFEVENLKQLIL